MDRLFWLRSLADELSRLAFTFPRTPGYMIMSSGEDLKTDLTEVDEEEEEVQTNIDIRWVVRDRFQLLVIRELSFLVIERERILWVGGRAHYLQN